MFYDSKVEEAENVKGSSSKRYNRFEKQKLPKLNLTVFEDPMKIESDTPFKLYNLINDVSPSPNMAKERERKSSNYNKAIKNK